MIRITDKTNCCGCHACYSACPQDCITMQTDHEGFWYPSVISVDCVNCGLCEKVCPILHQTTVDNAPKAYAAYNKDEKIRMESSSGGIFTLLAENIIDRGGVVFGAGFDKTFQVIHSYAETKQGLGKFRGSKYVQSKIGDTYKQAKTFLEHGQLVMFSGTPCQIGGLKANLRQEYDNLICQDIICHGVPSPKVWEKYVKFRESRTGALTQRISFRQKESGWKRYSVSFSFQNDTEYQETFDEDLMMRAFLRNLCLRPSCYHCKFKGLHRQSDITLADFWGIETIDPDMFDDKGTSLVVTNSDKGVALFQNVKDKLILKEENLIEATKYNLAAYQSVEYNPERKKLFSDLVRLDFDKLIKNHVAETIKMKIRRKIHCGINLIKNKLTISSRTL